MQANIKEYKGKHNYIAFYSQLILRQVQRPHPDRATTRSICKEFALICIKIALDFLNDPRNSPLILVTRIRILLQVRKGWVILLTACHATIIQMFTEGKRGLLSSPRTHG